jgi:thiamine-phosphate pyrophosphorylase
VTDLPPLLVLTDRHACERRGSSLAETVEVAVAGGARAFVLREKDLPRERRRELGEAIASLVRRVGGVLIVASDPALAGELGAGWLHLAGADTWPGGTSRGGAEGGSRRLTGLAPGGAGRSCHDAASLLRAREEGAAYATLSPVFPSASKPGYGPPLGVAGLARLVRTVPGLPVYALGGIDAGSAAGCRDAGAAGVAAMGAVMGAARPEVAVRELLASLNAQPAP